MKWNYVLWGVCLLLGAWLSGVYLQHANIPVLEPAGPIALGERTVMLITLALSGVVVVPVFFLLFYFAWKYRASNPDAEVHHNPNWDHDNLSAEFIWWVIPTVIIFFLGILAWQSSHALDPYNPIQGVGAPLEVQVVALDWKWLFIYPQENIASVNMLEIPEGRAIHFDLTADAPMNSFWIPQLGGQIMVMPGMTTQLNLLASKAGEFSGFSGNISGAGFSGMAFTARAVTQAEFDQWVSTVLATPLPLTQSAYDALALPSTYNPVSFYSSVDPSVYPSVSQKYMTPESGMMGEMNATAMPMQMPMGTSTTP